MTAGDVFGMLRQFFPMVESRIDSDSASFRAQRRINSADELRASLVDGKLRLETTDAKWREATTPKEARLFIAQAYRLLRDWN